MLDKSSIDKLTPSKKQRILIVDSNEIHRQIIRNALDRKYILETAPDSVMALRKLRQPYDLMTLELRLPRKIGEKLDMAEGLKILDELQESRGVQLLKIIIVSGGNISKEQSQKLKEIGIEAIFEKPFSSIDLQNTVDNLFK